MNNQAPYYIRMFIAVGYLIAGIICLTTPIAANALDSKKYGMLLGVLLIVYGLFRAYRNQKRWDAPNREEM